MVAAVQQWEAAALQWVVGVPAQVREEGAEAQTPQQLRTQEVEDLVARVRAKRSDNEPVLWTLQRRTKVQRQLEP